MNKPVLSRDIRARIEQIKSERNLAISEFRSAIARACKIGDWLLQIKKATDHGQWTAALGEIGIAERTARRWIEAAEVRAEQPERVSWLIENGAPMCALWREEAIQKPCDSGPYSNAAYNERKVAAANNKEGQIEFTFEFTYKPAIRGLLYSKKVEELGPETLRIIRRDLMGAQKRVEALLAEKEALPLTPDHQP